MNGWLCLSRDKGQIVTIGEPGTRLILPSGETLLLDKPIEVCFLRSNCGKPMIGVKAPRKVRVDRLEIYQERNA